MATPIPDPKILATLPPNSMIYNLYSQAQPVPSDPVAAGMGRFVGLCLGTNTAPDQRGGTPVVECNFLSFWVPGNE